MWSESRDTHGQWCPFHILETVRAGCIQIPKRRCLEVHRPTWSWLLPLSFLPSITGVDTIWHDIMFYYIDYITLKISNLICNFHIYISLRLTALRSASRYARICKCDCDRNRHSYRKGHRFPTIFIPPDRRAIIAIALETIGRVTRRISFKAMLALV